MAEAEMVEKVARAIANAPWHVGNGHEICLDMARAAIEAMRAPHITMIEAGKVLAVETPPHDKTGDVTAFHVWTAMIDAALSPPSKD